MKDYTAEEAYSNVLEGVKLLDAAEPTWRNHIDWERLDIENLAWCIIGQLSERFGYRWRESTLGLASYTEGIVYGFETPFGFRSGRHYRLLTEAWKKWAQGNLTELWLKELDK